MTSAELDMLTALHERILNHLTADDPDALLTGQPPFVGDVPVQVMFALWTAFG